jgi:hypothetical protein
MERSNKQILKFNSDSTDYNQSLVSLWKEYGHEPDIESDLTVTDLNVFGQRNWRTE